jgi:hypothetical protein
MYQVFLDKPTRESQQHQHSVQLFQYQWMFTSHAFFPGHLDCFSLYSLLPFISCFSFLSMQSFSTSSLRLFCFTVFLSSLFSSSLTFLFNLSSSLLSCFLLITLLSSLTLLYLFRPLLFLVYLAAVSLFWSMFTPKPCFYGTESRLFQSHFSLLLFTMHFYSASVSYLASRSRYFSRSLSSLCFSFSTFPSSLQKGFYL